MFTNFFSTVTRVQNFFSTKLLEAGDSKYNFRSTFQVSNNVVSCRRVVLFEILMVIENYVADESIILGPLIDSFY